MEWLFPLLRIVNIVRSHGGKALVQTCPLWDQVGELLAVRVAAAIAADGEETGFQRRSAVPIGS